MAIRLTEAHPLTKKLRGLEQYMMDNNISMEWNGYHMIFSDADSRADYRDADSGEDCTMFPNYFESKLTREE